VSLFIREKFLFVEKTNDQKTEEGQTKNYLARKMFQQKYLGF